VQVDTGSTVACSGNSDCTIECPNGGCIADCTGSAGCTVVCGESADCTVRCNGGGTRKCAAGSTCSKPC
jgi:hypothetical protein